MCILEAVEHIRVKSGGVMNFGEKMSFQAAGANKERLTGNVRRD